ncbi:GNAT family N-acetyltransferase [Desulfosporosinus sp. Sb-LF]|uniref:GNAT family N-acetyltransferase n=1 Tax=Desulfosporosinus sp. Sb-LF TaxID=2560027 RepID=UPI00107EF939|nr:GNAT family N-acetyltransferase [Desulfosporosinus sp. Sb-LF]TGE33813.1 GNAT family N-acetyltransferase [Desulfosporosinus sp. Sb-LF]
MWKAVKYLPENLAETIDMAREYYGESWISDTSYLKWQYEANPAGPAMIQLARDVKADQLAGQYVVIPMRFKAYDKTFNGILSLNTLTRQIFTGQGIFTGLAKTVYQDCAEQGMEFCYGFPNPNSYPGFTKKLGFTDLGSVPLLLRPLNTKALATQKFGSLIGSLVLPFQLFYNVKDRFDDRYEVYPLTAFDLSAVDVFWAKLQHKYPIMGIRDAAYLRWRYFENPYRDYQIYGIHKKNSSELSGYIVGRCTEVEGMASGMIVDFLVDPNVTDAGNLLINRLLRFFVDNNMDLAGSLMLPHTEESHILKANGFFTCPKALEPQPFPVIYRRLIPQEEDPFLQLNHWFLTMGDYDAI